MTVKGHEVVVNAQPKCNMCHDVDAKYDGKTIYGPWAFMCEPCWEQFGPGQTGVGFGQRLIVKAAS